MFDVFAKLLSSIASFLFPVFASYKALKTSDPAQLTPWLMYWVVLACALLVESWVEWILVWIPFYAYIRLFFLLYLVLPQTQGARHLYQTQIHPYLEENELAIDDFIASAHDRMRAAGIAYLKRAIEYFKTKVLNMPPEEPSAAEQHAASSGQSYTQSLLARFSLPAARWSSVAGTGAGAGTGAAAGGHNAAATDFYNLLAGAVSATLSSATVSRAAATTPTAGGRGGATLIPSSVHESEKASFIATQRERLSTLLAALDREAAQLAAARETDAALNLDGGNTPVPTASNPWDARSGRSGGDGDSPGRPSSGLSKTRSEHDFEKIEAESGAEDAGDDDDDRDGAAAVRRRTPGAAAAGGSWLPWGWGGSGAAGGSDVGTSSGVEK